MKLNSKLLIGVAALVAMTASPAFARRDGREARAEVREPAQPAEHAVPEHAVPEHAVPEHAVPEHAVPEHAMPEKERDRRGGRPPRSN